MCFKRLTVVVALIFLVLFGGLTVSAEEETAPREYFDFLDALPENIIDTLPNEALSDGNEQISAAAKEISSPTYLLKVTLDAFGANISEVLPVLALLCGIIMISAVINAMSSSLGGGIGKTAEACSRLCSYCAIAALSVSSLSRLEEYFNALFEAVAAFLPLSAALYAMGGNLTGAASSTATIGVTLTVCEFICTKTVIPVFCICLSFSLLSAFDGQGATVGGALSASVKKWYTTFISFVMMILTVTLASQSILSSKADTVAMRGAKFAVSSFVPLSGGALSGTLGTLASSVELIRGSVGVIGIVIILLMLIPVVVELALLRGALSIASFISGIVGCAGERRLMDEIGSLYGYLEGIAALSGAVFIIAFAIFAATATPFS